jgi:hypothetical protein
MPDTPLERSGGGPYDPALEPRVSRLEDDMRDMRTTMVRLEVSVARIEAMLDATLPHLATKAEVTDLRMEVRTGLADKPGKTYMWGILAVLITAYAAGLAALAIVR